MEKVGPKIRIERKKRGLSLEQLAHKVNISPMTLQRIETGKSSPSVVLLTEIANHLNKSVHSFLEDPETQKLPICIKQKNQLSVSSPMLKVKVIGPRKMIADNIVVTFGELRKGKSVDLHSNPGKEFSYIIKGKWEFRQDNQRILLETGDSILHDATKEHSISAIEKCQFFSIYIKAEE
ncbi:MAG: helix-turn-helix domain-containing protein [Thermodesulfobacteriota bacterium]